MSTRRISATYPAGQNFDTVVCLNVVEHIADDVGALRNIWDALARKAGAQSFWSLLGQIFTAVSTRCSGIAADTPRSSSSKLRSKLGSKWKRC